MRHVAAKFGVVMGSVVLCAWLGSTALAADAAVAYPWPESLFEQSMEIGDLAIWRRLETSGGGKVELSREVRHSGRYAARCAVPLGDGARQAQLIGQYTASPRFAAAREQNLRVYVYLGEDFSVGDTPVSILALGSFSAPPDGAYQGHLIEVAVRSSPAGLVLCMAGAAGDQAGSTVLPRRAWHCIEVRLVPGDGETAAVTALLNGREELSVSRLKLPRKPDGVAVGLLRCDSPKSGGSIIVDDVVVAEKPVGVQHVAVQLAHPSFVPRIGAPVVAILTGHRAEDRLVATLTSKAGLNRTVFEASGPFDGQVRFRVDLAGLPASTYSLTVRLLDVSGGERAAGVYRYEKPYDGDAEYSIDASNAIVHRGKKFFPVTSFGLNRKEIAEWKAKRYCNLVYGMDWVSEPPGVAGYRDYLDATVAAGMDCVGPAHDYRFDRPGKPQWAADNVKEYLLELGKHAGVAWWMWREEPINWKYDAASQKAWWDLGKEHTPQLMTELLDMGNCYQIGILKAKLVYMIWPHLAGDIYSWDIYPIENEHEKNGSFADYAEVADRAVNWNLGLVPVIPNVASADCTPGKRGGTPTPEEIAFVCWLSIVHQAKGIHWYPYQGKVPPENFAAMTRFVDETTALTEAILGDESPIPVTHQALGGNRVDLRATTDGQGNVYLFAVNLTRKAEKVRFMLGRRPDGKPLPEGLKVQVHGEDRVLDIEGSAFSDDFPPIGVRIYKLSGAAK